MSLESGRKFGYYASLMNVILPIVAIGVVVTFFVAIIGSAARGITSGTTAPAFSGIFSGSLNILFIAIGACGVVSFVMFMYAMYSLSNYYNEPAIFKNVLYAFIVSLVSGAVIIALVFAVLISAFMGISPANTPSALTPVFMQIILSYVVVVVVALAFGIVSGFLYMRAFNKLKEKSGVDNFGTAGLLYLIGVFIPFIMWIAWIFAAMGFNKLEAAPTVVPYPPYSTQPPLSSTTPTKRCPNCGTDNYGDASYCRNCGKTLQ
jgi:uncharacterized membrane protein